MTSPVGPSGAPKLTFTRDPIESRVDLGHLFINGKKYKVAIIGTNVTSMTDKQKEEGLVRAHLLAYDTLVQNPTAKKLEITGKKYELQTDKTTQGELKMTAKTVKDIESKEITYQVLGAKAPITKKISDILPKVKALQQAIKAFNPQTSSGKTTPTSPTPDELEKTAVKCDELFQEILTPSEPTPSASTPPPPPPKKPTPPARPKPSSERKESEETTPEGTPPTGILRPEEIVEEGTPPTADLGELTSEQSQRLEDAQARFILALKANLKNPTKATLDEFAEPIKIIRDLSESVPTEQRTKLKTLLKSLEAIQSGNASYVESNQLLRALVQGTSSVTQENIDAYKAHLAQGIAHLRGALEGIKDTLGIKQQLTALIRELDYLNAQVTAYAEKGDFTLESLHAFIAQLEKPKAEKSGSEATSIRKDYSKEVNSALEVIASAVESINFPKLNEAERYQQTEENLLSIQTTISSLFESSALTRSSVIQEAINGTSRLIPALITGYEALQQANDAISHESTPPKSSLEQEKHHLERARTTFDSIQEEDLSTILNEMQIREFTTLKREIQDKIQSLEEQIARYREPPSKTGPSSAAESAERPDRPS
jgi:hypothetical protein